MRAPGDRMIAGRSNGISYYSHKTDALSPCHDDDICVPLPLRYYRHTGVGPTYGVSGASTPKTEEMKEI